MATDTRPPGRIAPNGVGAPGRAAVGTRTLRRDRWWLQPAITFAVFSGFIVYATYRAFAGVDYFAAPYISPLFSPCLATSCVEGSSDLGTPIGDWYTLSPALIILIVPLSLRLTCYYYRKAYYRSFWQSPPACAVAEPHKKYSGETRFPLILQNIHRYALVLALVLNVILTYDAIIAFRDPEGGWGYFGLGTVILVVNAYLLWMYSLSCHSCRHVVGGRINTFSKHPMRYKAWTFVSRLNPHHPKFAWFSLFSVVIADLYVWLLASGTITDPHITF
jgi:hypothetical protein